MMGPGLGLTACGGDCGTCRILWGGLRGILLGFYMMTGWNKLLQRLMLCSDSDYTSLGT